MDLPGGGRSPSVHGNDTNSSARIQVQQFAQQAGRTLQSWTVRKYTLPDKSVASQVLMYRQLLHTKCRPGLKLSRDYQGTPAQVAVQHMPWWSEGMQETKRMVISYDNLIRRLWVHGAVRDDTDLHLDAEGAPPVPHEYWVSRMGFQQADPVTDFRSGGVLSLAMMVHVVESCTSVFDRFITGDAKVLPFGITSINVTDLMARNLMLAKSTDRMDALLSQKPFWRMFADPNALLVCQELAMDLLADVVVELRTDRQQHAAAARPTTVITDDDEEASRTNTTEPQDLVTVFDFATILNLTSQRVEHDLLGAGPQSVSELRAIHARIKARYAAQLQVRLQQQQLQRGESSLSNDRGASNHSSTTSSSAAVKDQVLQSATGLAAGASTFAGSMFSKFKAPGFNPLSSSRRDSSSSATTPSAPEPVPTVAVLPPVAPPPQDLMNASPPKPSSTAEPLQGPTLPPPTEDVDSEDGDWDGKDIQSATEAVSNFSIGGDEEDDEDL